MRETHLAGIHYLQAATRLLHRVRSSEPTAGLLEAADLHWWWRAPRPTDDLPQLFWFDERGEPLAAVIATDWGDGIALDPIVLPDAPADWVADVVERGIARGIELGFPAVDVVIDRADDAMFSLLTRHGFTVREGATLGVVCAWRAAGPRPAVSALADGCRLTSRLETAQRSHHMAGRNGSEVAARLEQSSLYRRDLDLLILDEHGAVAAYALFWLDPETAVGLVEPMRTEDRHQRRGLARHLLTVGINRLIDGGARRIKICYRPSHPGSRDLYLGVGFKPDTQTLVLARPLQRPPA